MNEAEKQREAEIKTMLRERLRQASALLQGHRAFLFGSRAAGSAHSRSDYDVGVIGDEPLPLRDFYAIEEMLDELPTLHKIDWVDFNRVSEEFRRRAMRTVEILYE